MIDNDRNRGDRGFFGSRVIIVLIAFALIAGFFLLLEHRAHVFGILPYVLLLACPLLHMFGHGGHGGHGKEDGADERGEKRSGASDNPHPDHH